MLLKDRLDLGGEVDWPRGFDACGVGCSRVVGTGVAIDQNRRRDEQDDTSPNGERSNMFETISPQLYGGISRNLPTYQT